MKVAVTVAKTIEADSAAALDTAYLAFVRTLAKEEELVSVQFDVISGVYIAFIVYTQ